MVDTWDTWDFDTSSAPALAVPTQAPSFAYAPSPDFLAQSAPPGGFEYAPSPDFLAQSSPLGGGLGLVDIGKAKGKGTTVNSFDSTWGAALPGDGGLGLQTASMSSYPGKGYDSSTFGASANGFGNASGKAVGGGGWLGGSLAPAPSAAPSAWGGYGSGYDAAPKGDYSTVGSALASAAGAKGGAYVAGAPMLPGTGPGIGLGITAKQSSKGALVAAMNAAGKGAGARPGAMLQPPPPPLHVATDFPAQMPQQLLGGKGLVMPPAGSMVPGGSSVAKPTQMLPLAPKRPLGAAQAVFNAQAGLSGSLPGPPAVFGKGRGLGKGVRGALPPSLLAQLQAARAATGPGASLPAPAALQPRGFPQPGGYPAVGYAALHPGQLALPPLSGLAPELAALVGAEADHTQVADTSLRLVPEKKPKLYLLLTKLPPEAQESHLEQLLEQCGEVHGWRRGRGPNGELLTFGFAQFGDPEAAWKASVCLAKRTICKQEIKVLVEEQAESQIQRWRELEKLKLKLSSDEDLDWELERKSVGCKALIDAKLEELYGPGAAEGDGAGGAAQRRQELRDKEQSRLERGRKRKAWRGTEFAKEFARVESGEKRLRREECERDDADRSRAEADKADKENAGPDNQLATRIEDVKPPPTAAAHPLGDNTALREMVDRVQSEPREMLFSMELDIFHLRHNKVLETKLRPWLEDKIDLYMGGPQSDLVEFVLRRVNACSDPQSLISDLVRYLDDNAESLVELMWRMLIFELMRNGLVLKGDRAGQQGAKLGWGM